jgi:hypothetical protein
VPNHLDPHSSAGFQRAVSGDLSMTAAEWRNGARLFRNGVRIKKTTSTEYIDRPDYAGWYTYKVRAIDAAGNKSEFSVKVKGQAIKGPL